MTFFPVEIPVLISNIQFGLVINGIVGYSFYLLPLDFRYQK